MASIQNEGEKVNRSQSFFLSKTLSFDEKQGTRNSYDDKGFGVQHSSLVKFCGRYRDYSYEMVDRLMAEQLWPGNGAPTLFADIELERTRVCIGENV